MKFDYILSLFQHGYKVKTSTLYHLLRGKRTTSVLIYGFLYDNLVAFGLFPLLSKTTYEECIQQLCVNNLLKRYSEVEVQITSNGIERNRQTKHFLEINNYLFGKAELACWRLLQFSVQVISNMSYHQINYIPLETSPYYQEKIKMWLKLMPKKELIRQNKMEWTEIFSELTDKEANFFAQQFSGYQLIGKAVFQLVEDDMNELTYFLWLKNRRQHLLSKIISLPNSALLKRLILPVLKENGNQSMYTTIDYLKNNCTIEEIVTKRKMKRGTIQDHLIEYALTNEFSFELLLSHHHFPENYHLIDCRIWNFQTIKKSMPQLDYFLFRLYQIQQIKNERGNK